MRASINIGCASRWFGSLQRPVGIRSLAVPLISRSGPVWGVVTYAYRQAAPVPLTYPAMTGFLAEGRFPQGRREAAGKQTRLVTGRAHTQTAMAATNKYLRAMAAPDKCLAQSNKSRTGGEATKKREISQSSLVGNGVCGRCAVSVCQSAGKRCTTHFLRNWTTPNMSMAATNKSLARNDKSRTWVEPTKKRRTPSRHADSHRHQQLAIPIIDGRFLSTERSK